MLIKTYFKQSWQVIWQNKLFSGVYILGTALAIAMVMAYAIVWYVKIAPVSPEVNRGRTLYMGYLAELDDKGGCKSSSMSHKFIETIFPENIMPDGIECIVEYCKYTDGEINVYSQNVPQGIDATICFTTEDICKVFDYNFLYGSSFTNEDVEAVAKKAFITKSYARKLFGTDNAVGMTVTLNFTDYIVCGVIKDVSLITSTSYSDIWVPISCDGEYEISNFGDTQMLGNLNAMILTRSSKDFESVKTLINGGIKRINNSLQNVKLENYEQPDTHFYSIFRRSSNSVPQLGESFTKILLVLLALLLVPAVNLAGIIASGMESRLEELGIRKAFGASRGTLLWQILCENFLLTFIGGVLGLLISYLIVWSASIWLLQIIDFSYDLSSNTQSVLITPSMLFNPAVFLGALLVCMIMNLLAAILPAIISLRKNIIYSLTSNKK